MAMMHVRHVRCSSCSGPLGDDACECHGWRWCYECKEYVPEYGKPPAGYVWNDETQRYVEGPRETQSDMGS